MNTTTRPDRRTRPYRSGVKTRAAILAMATPGQYLPTHREIAAKLGKGRATVGRHIDQLRAEWRLVTVPEPGKRGGERLMVVEVRR